MMTMAAIKVGFVFIAILAVLASNFAALAFDFRQLCGRTARKDVCISVIQADPRTTLKGSAGGLCTILNDEAKRVAGATSNKISHLRGRATNPDLAQDLRVCSDLYEEIVARLGGLNFSVLNNQTFGNSNLELFLSAANPGICEESFKLNQPTPLPSPLTADNKNLGDIIYTTFNILNLDHCQKISCLD